tara:strand:+ start:19497 stop:20708 length:1212 start_codon:yes stop_codon:yes gene_type:complete
MRRYELIDGSSQKFWEITLEGELVKRRWGRLGTSGQRSSKSFPDEHHARRGWEDLIAQKRKKGYVLVDKSPEIQVGADDEVDAVIEPRNAELEECIFANPDERDGYLVLGDWLLEQDHPRGELISANAQMVDQNDPVQFLRFKTIQTRLLAEHPGVFYGPTLKRHTEVLRIKWLLGYWQTLTVRGTSAVGLPANLADFLASVAASPSAFFLQELELQLRDQSRDMEFAGCLSKLGEHPLRALAKLTISTQYIDGLEVLSQACPALRQLRVDATMLRVVPGKWSLPTLESLSLRDTEQQDIRQLLDDVASPTLTMLELCDLSESNAHNLLSSAAMSSIEHLVLSGYNQRPGILQAFVDCHRFFGSLKTLKMTITVAPKQRDTKLESDFAALYPFAELTIHFRHD